MDVSHHDSVTVASTPAATKLGLVVEACARRLARLLRSCLEWADAGRILASLHCALCIPGSGAGQRWSLASPRWLPPMAQWNFVPYRALLPIQIVFLFAMSLIAADVLRGSGTLGEQSPAAGAGTRSSELRVLVDDGGTLRASHVPPARRAVVRRRHPHRLPLRARRLSLRLRLRTMPRLEAEAFALFKRVSFRLS